MGRESVEIAKDLIYLQILRSLIKFIMFLERGWYLVF